METPHPSIPEAQRIPNRAPAVLDLPTDVPSGVDSEIYIEHEESVLPDTIEV